MPLKTALVHDWLVGWGGAEKCLEAILDLYPSPIYALLKSEEWVRGTPFCRRVVHTSFLQRWPKAVTAYRNYLPLFPLAVEQFDLREFEVVLSSSHAVAKGVLTGPHQLHICYCYTPMRYAWDLYHQYLQGMGKVRRACAAWTLHYLRNWDAASARRVDHFVAISHYIARRIRKTYGRSSTVIYPPVATHRFAVSRAKENYYLALSRCVPYKRMDLILEAFRRLPDRTLFMIGDGPDWMRLKKNAPPNVRLLGRQSDEAVCEHLSRARAFVFAAEEDFGIAPVEAQAAGTPVIAFGQGGALETVADGKTGVFFEKQSVDSLVEAIQRFERLEGAFHPQAIREHAEQFSEERFKKEFRAFVERKTEEFDASRCAGGRQRLSPVASI
jgi:glycosyltransferase involved in cell wall biosynthesis